MLSRAIVHQSRPQSRLFFWSAPRTRIPEVCISRRMCWLILIACESKQCTMRMLAFLVLTKDKRAPIRGKNSNGSSNWSVESRIPGALFRILVNFRSHRLRCSIYHVLPRLTVPGSPRMNSNIPVVSNAKTSLAGLAGGFLDA